MTWLSTSCRRLVEAAAKSNHIGATGDDQNGGIKTTHWFWGASQRIQHAVDKKQVTEGDDEETAPTTPVVDSTQDASKELNDILLENPAMVAAALPQAMSAKGLKVVKTTEAFKRLFKEKAMDEGGPGSGRYPAGSGDEGSSGGGSSGGRITKQPWDASTKDTPEHDIRKADKKIAKIKSDLEKAKADLAAHDASRAAVDKAYNDASAANKARTQGKIAAAQKKYQARMAAIQAKYAKHKKEADSASAFPQMVRETSIKILPANFRESASDDGIGPTRFKCILIQEGLGNFGDAYYYHRSALESAVPVFTGAKIYADHPSTLEEETRPERSVRDVLGHFENIQIESDKSERAMLTGEVVVLPDKPYEWARALMRHAITHAEKFPDKDFIGLSINASGDANEAPIEQVMKDAPASALPKLAEAKQNGIESVKVVTKIKRAVSCDLVTEAGAGGKIINVIA